MKRAAFLVACAALALGFAASPIDAAKRIPVQHNGRVKPFDAFARQTLKLLSGKERWEGRPAWQAVFDGLAEPARLRKEAWVLVDFPPLKNELELAQDRKFFSLENLVPAEPKLLTLVRAAKAKRDKDERPSKLEQKAEAVYNRYRTADALASGDSVRLVPGSDGEWLAPATSGGFRARQFEALLSLYRDRAPAFGKTADEWTAATLAAAPEVSPARLAAEIIYYQTRPFEVAALAYLAAFVLILLSSKRGGRLARAGAAAFAIALVAHTAGLGARVYILSRPPVSNMFESMIFMSWALSVFSLVFGMLPATKSAGRRGGRAAFMTGSLGCALVVLYANLLPIDASLDVLVPVLRSNYWLSVHVMTVVSSYGAFGLAMALGHRHVWGVVTGRFTKKTAEESARLMDRVIQLGVLLIGTGTFLGGVWANESWGRFWGWDPKETWALVTFIGYLAVVHLRFAKKMSDFVLGVATIAEFQLVLMTWYGVNFVLGRGLHSYGAVSGGMAWVIYFLIFEAGFLAWAFSRSPRGRRASG